MTTNHLAEAERLLADADEWAAQAGELSPKASERACLDRAQVHALLAIHDTLAAADRYAANEERQREEAEPDTPSGRAFTARDKDATDAVQAKINALGEWLAVMEKALTLEPDPLDEDDHRDRIDGNGQRWGRMGGGCWHHEGKYPHDFGRCSWTLQQLQGAYGLLAFAPGVAQEAEPDPLDEDDHRDRVDNDGYIVRRKGRERWAWPEFPGFHDDAAGRPLSTIDRSDGPLAFAPEAAQEATGGDLSAPQGENEAEEGGDTDNAPEPLLCPECDHHINTHDVDGCLLTRCDCPRTPEDVARAMTEQAVNAERTRLTAQLRATTNSVIAELDELAAWEIDADG